MADNSELINKMDEYDCLPKNGDPILDDKKRNYKNREGKSCTYRFKYDGDDIVGWFKNHATGEFVKYISKSGDELTPEEKEARKRKMHNERRIRDRQLKEDQDAAAIVAKNRWTNAHAATDHPYLTKKGITGAGAKIYRNLLVIPVYKDKELINLQNITENGEKRFLKDGVISGAYGAIGKDKTRIYISEGFATAKSVYKGVKPYISVWAFVAGNIVATAEDVRKNYPDSEIIICADNDQWRFKPKSKPADFEAKKHDLDEWFKWQDEERLENLGLNTAIEAAKQITGFVLYPDSEFSDIENKITDFNDYDLHFGEKALLSRLNSAPMRPAEFIEGEQTAISSCVVTESLSAHSPSPTIQHQETIDEDWRERLICDGKGYPIKTSLKNNILFFQYHDVYSGIFKYNEFNHKITVAKCPPWENENEFHPHDLNDIDISQAAASMEDYGLSPDITRTHKALQVSADKDKFHPAREYFDTLEWDGVKRLDTWIEKYFGADLSDGKEYLSFIGVKWMVAAVKRVYEPGCGFHHILVIEGNQGAGKSQSLKTLSTFGKDRPEAYFTDSVSLTDIQNKDTIPKLQGSIIVELAELSGFSKKDDEEIKRWITLDHDLTRLPYERTPKRFDRQFVLAATTNNSDYLKDPTGNRRFWPFDALDIDSKGLERDKELLWAEAVHLYKSGFDIIPDPSERALAEKITRKRMMVDTWEDDVEGSIIGLGMHKMNEGFKTNEVMRGMGLGLKEQDFRNSQRVNKIIQIMGFSSKVKRVNGKAERVWIKENKPQEKELDF